MTVGRLCWVVEGEPLELGVALARLGTDALAGLGQGRVFVDARRASDAAATVAPGSRIEVFAARAAPGPDAGAAVLAEHGELIVADKPALLATEPDRSGSAVTLISEVARLLGCPASELHAVSRLDVGVSGAVLLTRRRRGTPARAALSEHARTYLAIAQAAPRPERGLWSSAVERAGRGAQPAETRFACVAVTSGGGVRSQTRERTPLSPALLALAPVTGRTHQLRIHAARAGAPLLGDRAHGGPSRLLAPDGAVREISRIALHAARVCIATSSGLRLEVDAPVPLELSQLWSELGGSTGDWQRALSAGLTL